jgi:glycosyltransferase involved in cell wall biosynthesis
VSQDLRASVVIPTFERCRSVHRLLTALAGQTSPASGFEVIVALDGSTDGTQEMVQAFPAPYALRAAWQPHGGRAAACNLGVQHSRADLIIILDDDMEPTPGFVAAHCAHHPPGSRLGVIGAVPIVVEPNTPPVTRFIAAKFNAHLERLAGAKTTIGVRDFYSGNFSIRRDVLQSVGGFDQHFQLYGNEDGELAARLKKAGVQLIYSHDASARQHYEKDFAALAEDNIAKGRTAILMVSKHPDQLNRLRIGTGGRGSRKWRVLRAMLVKISIYSPQISQHVIRLMKLAERRRLSGLFKWYKRTLDYFFWLGVEKELDELSRTAEGEARRLRALLGTAG